MKKAEEKHRQLECRVIDYAKRNFQLENEKLQMEEGMKDCINSFQAASKEQETRNHELVCELIKNQDELVIAPQTDV